MHERLPPTNRPLAEREQEPKAAPSAAAIRKRLGIQAKLTVGAADDMYEREADQIAREVIQRINATGAEMPAVAGAASDGPQRIRRRAVVDGKGGAVDADTERLISSERGGGRQLDAKVQRTLGGALGADLSSVRIHEGGTATELNNRVQAKAFTLGSDVFMQRKLDTNSSAGMELLTHELVHVVQQGGASRSLQRAAVGTPAPIPTAEPGEEIEEAEEELEGEEVEGTELEGAETEAETDGGPGIAESGTVPDSGPMEDVAVEKGPYDVQGPRRKARGSKGDQGVRMKARFSSVTATSVENSSGAGDRRDAVKSGATVSFSNPGGTSKSAFGSESFLPGFAKVAWTQDEAENSPLNVSFDLKVKCPWGVKSGGHKDVPSGTAGVVKASNYQDIIDDLTPKLEEKSWRAPRSTYWSKTICQRHERYHSTDDKSWVEGPGKNRVLAYLDSQTIDLTPKERKSKAAVTKKVSAHLKDAMIDLGNANSDFYTGGETSYASYAGEQRANMDGKQPYLDLVEAVRKQGELLVAAEDKKKDEKQKAQEAKKNKGKTGGAE